MTTSIQLVVIALALTISPTVFGHGSTSIVTPADGNNNRILVNKGITQAGL